MSKAPRKLTLTRETLVPLQNHDLDAVNGGTSPLASMVVRSAVQASVRVCSAVSRAVSRVSAAYVSNILNSKPAEGSGNPQGQPSPQQDQ
jgi:hypothetical protein